MQANIVGDNMKTNIYTITIDKKVTDNSIIDRTAIGSTIIYAVNATDSEIGKVKRAIIDLYEEVKSNNVGGENIKQEKTRGDEKAKRI